MLVILLKHLPSLRSQISVSSLQLHCNCKPMKFSQEINEGKKPTQFCPPVMNEIWHMEFTQQREKTAESVCHLTPQIKTQGYKITKSLAFHRYLALFKQTQVQEVLKNVFLCHYSLLPPCGDVHMCPLTRSTVATTSIWEHKMYGCHYIG